MKFYFTILFCCYSLGLFAQLSLQGQIISADDQQGVEAVHVFIANTTIGTFSDANGFYYLENIPMGKQQIVFSHVAYDIQLKIIHVKNRQAQKLDLELKAISKELATVEVSAKKNRKWQRDLKKFTKAFFGQTPNALRCKILNPTVLNLESNTDGRLIAHASDLLEIENRALGYRLYFLLEFFEQKGAEVSYAGKTLFVPLEPKDKKEAQRWHKHRQRTYEGSMRHFLKALIQNELAKAGFELFHARLNAAGGFDIVGSANPRQLLQEGSQSLERFLTFDNFLKIVYHREKDKITVAQGGIGSAGDLGHPTEQDMGNDGSGNSRPNPENQVSYLFARSPKISLDTNGVLLQSELLIEYGYWHYERVADMLPNEYRISRKPKALMTTLPPERKGFILDRLLVPLSDIRDGGPPKDGIPSIDFPKFLSPDEAQFLEDEAEVLGLSLNGISTAYPIRILNFHEVVNDQFGTEAVTISYCPLCGSGLAFRAGTVEQSRVLGVSGLLYNSDVLLYDRATESLWSQVLGKAIAGPLSGNTLEMLPLVRTTWRDWKNRHPETMVLSTDTGHQRDYRRSPYQGYEQRPDILFPVSHESKAWPAKERVLGIEVNGKYKAYPFSELQKKESPFTDTINGQELLLHYDAGNRAAWATTGAGAIYPATTLYWFAWYAFHPTTEVFNED